MDGSRLRFKSAILNSLIAAVAVLSFFSFMGDGQALIMLLLIAVASISAFFFGWLFAGWYEVMPGERFLYEPYVVTTVISFPSAMVSGVAYALYMSSELSWFYASDVISTGVIGGFIAAIYVLPVSLILGALLGWYLLKGQAK